MSILGRWPVADFEDLRDALAAAYADPSRGYHDTRHLIEVLDRLDELATTTPFERAPVVLAAWFHDGVYDGEAGAEERSAVWALTSGVPFAEEVARLVRMTEHHKPANDDLNGCALSDADLAILAAPAERYAEYAATVRQEYAEIPDDLFAAGRAAILADLLAKPTLFHTAHAQAHWESAARANVERELSVLRASGAAARP